MLLLSILRINRADDQADNHNKFVKLQNDK